jgi:hypothetical protein
MRDEEENAAATRALLRWGLVAGPFYLAIGLAQALLRDGFDLSRHSLSILANGPGGWIQTLNFLLTGAMVVAAAIGLTRVLRAQSRAAGWWLGAFGVSMIAAAAFTADPADGFPVGTPLGMPATISTVGLLHFVAGAIGFVSLGIAGIMTAVALSRRGETSLARFSLTSGIGVLLGFFGGMALASAVSPVAGIWFSVVLGWAWLAVLSIRLSRMAGRAGAATPQA